MKRVAKVAKDTCYGNTYKVVQTLYEKGPLDIRGMASRLGMPDDRVKKAVNVLVSIDCVRPDTLPAASGATGRGKNIYRLSVGTKGLMDRLKKLLGGTLE
jgi:predicted transcriptional regulator